MKRKKPLAGIYQLTTFLALVLLLLILFVSVAYFFFIPAPGDAPGSRDLLAELSEQRGTWDARQPAAYRYVVDRDCYCERTYIEPYVATEEPGGKLAAFTIEIETASGEFVAVPPEPVWIDDLFDLVDRSIREGKHVEVGYDKELGYPSSVTVHPVPRAPDSVYRIEVRDFETLEYR